MANKISKYDKVVQPEVKDHITSGVYIIKNTGPILRGSEPETRVAVIDQLKTIRLYSFDGNFDRLMSHEEFHSWKLRNKVIGFTQSGSPMLFSTLVINCP